MRRDPSFDPLTDLIVCPACYQRMTAGEGGTTLGCTGCGRCYPIEDGLPVLLVERATMKCS